MEHGIQIDIHQIPEVLIIAACHREHGLVRIGHGIQEGIHGSLDQLYKRILGRILLRTAQDRVFYDVRDTGGVLRGRAERNVEYLVVIFIFDQHDPGPGLVVLQHIAHRADISEICLLDQCVCFQIL